MLTLRDGKSKIDQKWYRLITDRIRGNLIYIIQEFGVNEQPIYIDSFFYRIDAECKLTELLGG